MLPRYESGDLHPVRPDPNDRRQPGPEPVQHVVPNSALDGTSAATPLVGASRRASLGEVKGDRQEAKMYPERVEKS